MMIETDTRGLSNEISGTMSFILGFESGDTDLFILSYCRVVSHQLDRVIGGILLLL